ncbi:MAG: hypothetical protein IPK04_14340 [Bdellovibrionales bacterium]|nr:hypothetical protein [Bdellovibrionales bacterium]
MERLPPFFLNKDVVGPNSLRLFLLFYQSSKAYPQRRSHRFTRDDLMKITHLSYNSCQAGIAELILLKIVILDPFDISKTHFIVNKSEEYNWEELRRRQGLKIEGVPNSAEGFPESADSD